MTGFLLDTNVLSKLARSRPDNRGARWIDRQDRLSLFISEVSVGEIHKGIAKLPASRRREEIKTWLQRVLLHDFHERVLAVDRRVWIAWGRLCGEALRRGRPLPAIDALLAATAIEHNLTLVTRDIRPLRGTGAKLYSPWRS